MENANASTIKLLVIVFRELQIAKFEAIHMRTAAVTIQTLVIGLNNPDVVR